MKCDIQGKGNGMDRRKLMGIVITALLLISVPAFAESGKFSLGVQGGWAWPTADEALWGQSGTQFDSTTVYAGGLMYRFPEGAAIELAAESIEFALKDSGYELGKLEMTPVMILFKAQGMPKDGTGFTGHAEIGGGMNFARFNQGPSATESGFEFSVDIEERSFIFVLGAGADYFITPHLSLSLDARWLAGEIESTWRWTEPGKPEKEDRLFLIYNFQGLLGIRLWF